MIPKVAICIPYYRGVEGPTLFCCMDLAAYSAAHAQMMTISCSGCYVEDNREGAVEFAMNTGVPFDWLLWIDGDMMFPHDALVRLMAHGKDIVGANYRQRTPPYAYVGHYLNGLEPDLRAPGLYPMGHLPTGFLLTRFDVYRHLPQPWFKAGSRGEARDDVYFCRQALAAGYEIWCDHDLTMQIRHISTQEIGWFAPEQIVRVQGAQINVDKSAEESQKRAKLSRKVFEAGAPAILENP